MMQGVNPMVANETSGLLETEHNVPPLVMEALKKCPVRAFTKAASYIKRTLEEPQVLVFCH